jgi:hypothetical protein
VRKKLLRILPIVHSTPRFLREAEDS